MKLHEALFLLGEHLEEPNYKYEQLQEDLKTETKDTEPAPKQSNFIGQLAGWLGLGKKKPDISVPSGDHLS